MDSELCGYSTTVLSSQTMVNAFIGTCGRNHANSLAIRGSDIVDLSPLDGLLSIGGYLSVDELDSTYTELDNIFPNLETVGGIYWYSNPNIVTIDGFHNLVETGDNIDFWFNEQLTSITGFENLQVAGWSLEFGGNPNLTVIPDFPNLTTITSSLFIMNNPSLLEITGFNALDYVDWSFGITGNVGLTTICGFHSYFTEVDTTAGGYTGGGTLDISGNADGFPQTKGGRGTSVDSYLTLGPCCDSYGGKNECNTAAQGCFWGKSDCSATANGVGGGNVCCPGVPITKSSCGTKDSGVYCSADEECASCTCKGGNGPFSGTCK